LAYWTQPLASRRIMTARDSFLICAAFLALLAYALF
jgi:hypothetical protein